MNITREGGRGEKKEEIYEDLKINARGTIKFCKTTRWKVADNFGFPGSFLSTPLKNGRVTVVGGTKKGRVKPLLYKIFDASHGGLPAWQSLITFRWQILRVLIHHIIPRVCSRPLPSVPFFLLSPAWVPSTSPPPPLYPRGRPDS